MNLMNVPKDYISCLLHPFASRVIVLTACLWGSDSLAYLAYAGSRTGCQPQPSASSDTSFYVQILNKMKSLWVGEVM
jgi:hypothetical protein